MVHMGATENSLVLELQIFEADWTGFTDLTPMKKLLLNTCPLMLSKWLWRFVYEA